MITMSLIILPLSYKHTKGLQLANKLTGKESHWKPRGSYIKPQSTSTSQ